MTKKMLIDATHAEETRVVVVDGSRVDEFDFESLNKRQLTGNIYLAKVTRVEPSLQAAFVDYGGNRHGFLAFSEIHPDYYQIPKADRDALLREEAEAARAEAEAENRENPKPRGRSRSRKKTAAESARTEDAVIASEPIEGAADLADAPAAAAAGESDTAAGEPSPENGNGESTREREPVGDYEAVGGDDVEDERRSTKPRQHQRRYKIQEVIKVRQILLVQVVKEERGNKGAALTTYLSLAGRYCVLMPNTARGGGISRKITSAPDRKKLKEIAGSMTVPPGAGLIIRTAGANRTKTEIKRDYEYLLRQWEQLRDLTLKSIAPKLIYEEGNLVKRSIRDLYSRDIDEILVDGERGYREAKDYMKMLMPSHAKNVRHYAEPLPLFSRFQVESYLSAMFNPVVQLKAGGYIVIDVTEALVAIDVNSGRATREASIEETALKTNLEAAEEAARQMRLRDLAGLIVIDFIDMEDRKNNAAVEKRLKDRLKSDRARLQVGRISGFGLLEMSRQRLRPGMIEATTKACPHCHGTGRVRSDDSMALALVRELEEEGVRQRSKEVLVAAPVEIANYLLNQKREHIALIETRFGLSVRIEGDPGLISPDYRLERFKTASRIIPTLETSLPAVPYPDEDEDEVTGEAEAAELEEETEAASEGAVNDDRKDGKKRRRRRRRGGRRQGEGDADAADTRAEPAAAGGIEPEAEVEPVAVAADAATEAGATETEPDKRARSRRRSRGRAAADAPVQASASPFNEVIDLVAEDSTSEMIEVPEADAPQRRSRERVRKPASASAQSELEPEAPPAAAPAQSEPEAAAGAAELAVRPSDPGFAKPATAASAPEQGAAENWGPAPDSEAVDKPPEAALAGSDGPTAATETAEPEGSESEASVPAPEAAEGGDTSEAPKRRGWWSRALGPSS